MGFQSPITDSQLDRVASRATQLFRTGKVASATDAVVKAASEARAPYTAEHVRRVCEKTYREIFAQEHQSKEGSADRPISFDPPDATIAAQRLMASKVASARTFLSSAMSGAGAEAEKVASAGPAPYQPTNVFDLVTKSAAAPETPASTVQDVRVATRDLQQAHGNLRAKLAGAKSAAQIALFDLLESAKIAMTQGISADEMLLACGEVAREKVPQQFVEKAAEYLVDGLVQQRMPLGEKRAVAPCRANPDHPVVIRFQKFAGLLYDYATFEEALKEVQPAYVRAREVLRELAG